MENVSSASLPSLQEALEYIENLNLNHIVHRLSYDPKKTGWLKKDALKCCQQYKNYLILIKKYPNHSIVPSLLIDEFWHEHILHTQEYELDCMAIFGYFLHHAPGTKTSKEELMNFIKLFDEVTQELYFKEFGEYL